MILIKQTHNPKLVPNMLLNDSTIYIHTQGRSNKIGGSDLILKMAPNKNN